MQVKLNLAIRPSLRERYGVRWAILLVVVSVGALSWLISRGMADFRTYRSLRSQVALQESNLEVLEKHENDLRNQLERPQFRDTALKAQMVNTLIERKAVSFPEVAERVARLIPADVRITGLGLSFEAAGPSVRIAVVGKSQPAVESVLKALQDSPDFSDAEVQSEDPATKENNGEGATMVLNARYMGKQKRI